MNGWWHTSPEFRTPCSLALLLVGSDWLVWVAVNNDRQPQLEHFKAYWCLLYSTVYYPFVLIQWASKKEFFCSI